MKRLVAYCGITCSDCQALLATRENDDVKRKQIADEWDMKPEDVNCVGCTDPAGPHIDYWETCSIRTCGSTKKVETCASCSDYSCEKLTSFHEKSPKAKETLENLCKTTVEKK
ncbi:MAG: DUF3795 domain-containing protein [Candidatus Bathyarchaeota archaeon]|nr:MAG: DUF3795 domain-containing protein [Candidatus Bathyarchaeota archaeon]